MNRPYAIGFSTCGIVDADFDLVRVLRRLVDVGYDGVEIELRRDRLHPQVHCAAAVREIRDALTELGLRSVVGTGARHVLTETRHHPGIVSAEVADRRHWLEFAKASIRIAAELGSEAVMIHSSYAPPAIARDTVRGWLLDGLAELEREAERLGQRIALEWHPSMFVRTMDDMLDAIDPFGPAIGCTLDVGHAHCTESTRIAEVIERLAERTYHVQLNDHRDCVHEHLLLGAGELDFHEIFEAFNRTRYAGIVALEFNAQDTLHGWLPEQSMAYLREHHATELGWA